MKDQLSIKVTIAGRIYPLTIERHEEESVRRAVKLINEKITGDVLRVNYFKVLDWYAYYGLFNSEGTGCPDNFKATISGKINLEKINEILKSKIVEAGRNLPKNIRSRVFEGSSNYDRCVISSGAWDNKNKAAGFVLLQEIGLVGGMSWKEGCYGIKINKNKLKGKLLKFNRGYYCSERDCENPGSRLLISKINNGILEYTHQKTNEQNNLEYDLKGIK